MIVSSCIVSLDGTAEGIRETIGRKVSNIITIVIINLFVFLIIRFVSFFYILFLSLFVDQECEWHSGKTKKRSRTRLS